MIYNAKRKMPLLCVAFLAMFVVMLGTSFAFAQSIQLSPEQQQMLDQLPPAQRQQALSALQQLQSQGQVNSNLSTVTEQETADLRRVPIRVPDDSLEKTPLKASAHSRIILTITPKESLSSIRADEIDEDPLLSQLKGKHQFTLDDSGVLSVMGLQSIPILGLTETAIADRLSAEAVFGPFDILASILEIQPTGVEALKPFGYDLFDSSEIGFDPPLAGPVPPEYVLGPGDSIRVQLFGNVNGVYEYDVSRDGVLNLPELGPVTVSGLSFAEFRQDLKNRVNEMLIGTQVSVSMGQLRTIRVFVLGDANRPGSYVVSSLATISSALHRSGGLSEIGSMREISLKRRGKTVAILDLYDLLLKGDTSGDRRLQSGDVIFVAPIGSSVTVGGAVRRPATYEIKAKTTVAGIIQLAGGLDSEAYPQAARLERIDPDKGRIVLSVDADAAAGKGTVIIDGDTLIVPKVLPDVNDAVVLSGHVQRPGTYQWRSGMRLTDIVPTALDLAPGADANYVLIRRESETDRSIKVVSADLGAALLNPGSSADIVLQSRDSVYVFSLEFGRQRIIAPILDELRLQSRFGSPYDVVSVDGQVRSPGKYPLEAGMRISHLIRAGGNMREGAYAHSAELSRFALVDGEYRAQEIINVDLDAILRGDSASDIELSAHDYLSISLVPEWDVNWSVSLNGEVKFPGTYQVLRGETLSQLLERAGGLTKHAFARGAIFLRESLKHREREQLDILAARMEADLTSLSLETATTAGGDALQIGRSLLTQLRNTEPVGRLVINIGEITGQDGGRSSILQDVVLRDGDQLLVPVYSQEVTVIGEIQQPASHLYQPGLSRRDYIQMSGGITRRADKKLIYVVRANGAVIASNRSKWFGRGGTMKILPGDTIVAPLETDRIRPLTFWTNVTQILYQGAIAVAAIKTFDN